MTTVQRMQCRMRMGPVAGKNQDCILYQTFVNCDDAGEPFVCSAARCSTRVTYDCYYCTRHLRTFFGVEVRPSQIPGAGMGLFTTRDVRKGDRIVHYGGEEITPDEMHNRYGWMRDDTNEYIQVVAPYAMTIRDSTNTLDAIRIRGAASYMNDATTSTQYTNNVDLATDFVYAQRNLRAGEELFTAYGDEYWSCASPDIVHHQTTLEDYVLPTGNESGRKRRRVQQ